MLGKKGRYWKAGNSMENVEGGKVEGRMRRRRSSCVVYVMVCRGSLKLSGAVEDRCRVLRRSFDWWR